MQVETTKKHITIALAGNPNAGKTSLFNQLTGARAHVGNYPGVTVEKKTGCFNHDGWDVEVVDLPGTYSLTAYSLEEIVAREFIIKEKPDLVVDVVDAANLERNLYLAVQFMEIGVPVVIALNMMDMAEARGMKIDLEKLKTLLGVEVVPTVARSGNGIKDIMDAVVRVGREEHEWHPKKIRYGPDLDVRISRISELIDSSKLGIDGISTKWMAVKILEGDSEVAKALDDDELTAGKIRTEVEEVTRHLRSTVDDEPEGVIADHRYGFISSITKQALFWERDWRRTMSDHIDMVLLNRLVGPIILLGVLWGVYQFTFWASEPMVGWFEAMFGALGDWVRQTVPPGDFQSLIASGIIDGVGGVVGFVPLIAFMFFAIAVLEDTGYMARIAFILDRLLRTFGLHGSSVLSLMVGGGLAGGCAVPGVMAARTLRDPKERLATILVTPFMNCGAKIPVFAVLIAAFFAENKARMLFLLTLLAWAMALIAARLLRWTILKGEQTPFVMELPPYRLPTLRGLFIHTWERVWEYLKKAGTIILAVSIILWAMMTYPGLPKDMEAVFDHQAAQIDIEFLEKNKDVWPDRDALDRFDAYLAGAKDPNEAMAVRFKSLAETIGRLRAGEVPEKDENVYLSAAQAYVERENGKQILKEAQAQAAIRRSAAGRLGMLMEHITRPLGFDWRTDVALLGGFAAKEVIVSGLGTAYSLGDSDAETSLASKLAAEPGWSPLVALTLMLFVMMYSPCSVTIVAIGREVGWRWAIFAMIYTTSAAYLVCLVVAQGGRALGF